MPLNIHCAVLQDVHEANVLFVPRPCSAGDTWVCTSQEQRKIAGTWGVSQTPQSQMKMYLPLQFWALFSPAISFWHQFPLDFFFQGGSKQCPRSELLSPFRCLQMNFLCFHLQMFQLVHKEQRLQETSGELYRGFQKPSHMLQYQQCSSASLVESVEFIHFFSVSLCAYRRQQLLCRFQRGGCDHAFHSP